MMCQARTTSLKVSAARMKASTIIELWVMISIFRREMRSAMVPAKSENNHTGMPLAKPTIPNMMGDPVRSYTRYPWAVVCIHVPMRETI